MVAYLKNWVISINEIIFYKLENNIKPNFSYLKMAGSGAWVHTLKK